MALTGLEIYKLLPQTNCKECNFPTCLAFAMKLAAKQASLKDCPYVSEEAKIKLEAAASPPIRLIELQAEGGDLSVGNETVLFRHEKTFYHKPGLFWQLKDTQGIEEIKKEAAKAEAFNVDYVGIDLYLDGFAIEAASEDPATFGAAVSAIRSASKKPLILQVSSAELAKAGLEAANGTRPLLHAADDTNWEAMAEVAKEASVPLAVHANNLDELADLTQKLVQAGV
jgi:acetyl-CoA decarbonylase/synthase complex subunit gamma